VLVGSGLAWGQEAFRWDAFAVALVAAVLINIGANFANDVSDARRGADGPARIGPARAVASGLISSRAMWAGVALVFGLAATGGIYLAVIAGWPVLAIGAACLLAAVTYTGGPFPYGYRALGEAAVFVFFGLAGRWAPASCTTAPPAPGLAPGHPRGLLVASILVANNVRDVDTDRAAGKVTLAVLLGRRAAGGSSPPWCSAPSWFWPWRPASAGCPGGRCWATSPSPGPSPSSCPSSEGEPARR